MKAIEMEIRKYQALNALAEQGATVIFGGGEDREIPVCELKQSFALPLTIYNRSLDGLTLEEARAAYDACVAPLAPARILLHLGEDDLHRFAEDPAAVMRDYRALLSHIRSLDKTCEMTLVSLKNPEAQPLITEINRQMKLLADSERCGFEDIAARRVWNPAAMKETISFLYSTGFVRPLRSALPVYDLVRILYGYDAALESAQELPVPRRSRLCKRMGLPKASFT